MDLFAFEAVVVRPATLADAGAIARIHGAAYADTYGLSGEPLRAAQEERAAIWPRVLGGETSPPTVLVAVAGERVLGFGATHPVRDDWAWEYLTSLYVSAEMRALGIGALLLRELADRLTAVGRRQLRCTVLSENARARAFYARMGAREAGQQPGVLGEREVTAIVLDWPRLLERSVAARRALGARRAPPVAFTPAGAP
ncbi:MAG: GNAT family N-acetyltransferase, partial [Pseudomonadota bacterium]